MSIFFILGVGTSKLQEKNIKTKTLCTNCLQESNFELKGEASYIHLFWIPIIPLPKKVHVECLNCGKHFSKNNAPAGIQEAIKAHKMYRPFWHFIIPILLLYVVFKVVFFLGSAYISDYQDEVNREEQKAQRVQNETDWEEMYQKDLSSVQIAPNAQDSIAYKIKQEFPFETYNIAENRVALRSKLKNGSLLLMIDIQGDAFVSTLDGCTLVGKIRKFISEAYPNNSFRFYIGLYKNGTFEMSHAPNEVYATTYEKAFPLYSFYAYDYREDFYPDKAKKIKFLEQYVRNDVSERNIDTVAIRKGFENVTNTFKFGYRSKEALEIDKIEYECKFTLESGNVVPEEIRVMFNLYNGNGPFINLNSLHKRTAYVQQTFKEMRLDELRLDRNYDERLIPMQLSPYWIPFYKDEAYTYALDMMPTAKGTVGQVILFTETTTPRYIAKNMTEFLKLLNDGKLATDFDIWLPSK